MENSFYQPESRADFMFYDIVEYQRKNKFWVVKLQFVLEIFFSVLWRFAFPAHFLVELKAFKDQLQLNKQPSKIQIQLSLHFHRQPPDWTLFVNFLRWTKLALLNISLKIQIAFDKSKCSIKRKSRSKRILEKSSFMWKHCGKWRKLQKPIRQEKKCFPKISKVALANRLVDAVISTQLDEQKTWISQFLDLRWVRQGIPFAKKKFSAPLPARLARKFPFNVKKIEETRRRKSLHYANIHERAIINQNIYALKIESRFARWSRGALLKTRWTGVWLS